MGVVYRAEDTTLRRPVALKFLTEASYGDEQIRARFLREARTAAALNHPGICTIHEVSEVRPGEERMLGDEQRVEAGTLFIVMEWVEGRTLAEVLEQSGALPLDRLLRIASRIAEGLALAHTKGIVHRDLKPGNVMVLPDDRIKILDFGLAKPQEPAPAGDAVLTAAETVSAELTRAGKVLGTVAYMSPEQAMGKPVDSRSDVFAFGILLYEMAAGKRPFRGESSTSTLAKILEAEPAPLTETRSDLPDELRRIVRRCLHKRPDERYNDTRDLAVALHELRQETTSGKVGVAAAAAAPGSARQAWWIAGTAIVALAVAAGAYWLVGGRAPSSPLAPVAPGAAAAVSERKMIAVLPLENLGSPEDEYFAAGITDELTSRLAVVGRLGVISRSSAAQYAGTTKTTRQIGEELGVDYLLEGTVRWARGDAGTSRVRITPQLIRVADDTHLWARTYDAVIDDIFEIQSEISRNVVEQLGLVLLEAEIRATGDRPTENLEAYQAYLRGRYHYERSEYPEALQHFGRAVELDEGFALAWAKMAEVHSITEFFGRVAAGEGRAKARQALDRATGLAPDLPEVHAALGMYHYHQRDYSLALEQLVLAEQAAPGDTDVLQVKAWVLRRMGRWDEALVGLERALELNPRDAFLLHVLAESCVWTRRYDEGVRHADRFYLLEPETPRSLKAQAHWGRGSLRDARAALEELAPVEGAWQEYHDWIRFWQEIYEERYESAVGRLPSGDAVWIRVGIHTRPKALLEAMAHDFAGESRFARSAYDRARAALEAELRESPDDPRLHASLGLALAGLGRNEEAIREGRRAVELQPVSRDALFGAGHVADLARIYAVTGEHDAAIDEIEYLLSIPSLVSLPLLRIDPRWHPLRDHPRFSRLLEQGK